MLYHTFNALGTLMYMLKSTDNLSPFGVITIDVISSSLLGETSYFPSSALGVADKMKLAGALKYTHALALPDIVL